MGHHHCKAHKVTQTAVTDAILRKRIDEQAALPKVKWGSQETTNAWRTKYLGSMFVAGGGCTTDVKIRIAAARQRFGKMRHIWADKRLYLNLRLRLYKSSVCSVMHDLWVRSLTADRRGNQSAKWCELADAKCHHRQNSTR